MRKAEFQKIKKHIESFCGSEEDAVRLLGQTKKVLKIDNNFIAAKEMIDSGELEIYYEDAEKFLKVLYGEKYNESTYRTKEGDFRTKNGEVYIWTVYRNKMATALVKMAEEVEL